MHLDHIRVVLTAKTDHTGLRRKRICDTAPILLKNPFIDLFRANSFSPLYQMSLLGKHQLINACQLLQAPNICRRGRRLFLFERVVLQISLDTSLNVRVSCLGSDPFSGQEASIHQRQYPMSYCVTFPTTLTER